MFSRVTIFVLIAQLFTVHAALAQSSFMHARKTCPDKIREHLNNLEYQGFKCGLESRPVKSLSIDNEPILIYSYNCITRSQGIKMEARVRMMDCGIEISQRPFNPNLKTYETTQAQIDTEGVE